MGLMARGIDLLFGDGRNVLRETAGLFRESPEQGAVRQAALREQVLAQYAAEFAAPRQGWFDRMIDGLNRLPRPMLAFGTLGLFVSAMVDPAWFASRMQGIAVVPEPLWWLMGAIVSFYFGARHQAKSQAFQRSVTASAALVPQVLAWQDQLDQRGPRAPVGGRPKPTGIGHESAAAEKAAQKAAQKAARQDDNPALLEWSRGRE